jgi:hypothetical protein
MPTLQEILDNDLGLGSEKVAEAQTTEIDETTKLAMSIGLIDENNETEPSQDNKGLNKEARMSLDKVYADLFPADADIVGEEKVASEYSEAVEMEKEAAAIEGAIGERAFDYFAQYVDAHITKIAAEIADKMEHEIEGKLEDNEDDSGEAIGTEADEGAEGEAAMGINPEGAVGSYEMKQSPHGELKQAAINKHLLKMFLNK